MWRDYEKDVFCPAVLGDGVLPDRLQCGGGVKQTAEETEETTEETTEEWFEAESEYISEEDLLSFIVLYDLYVVQRSEAIADTAEDEDEPYDPLHCLSTLDIYDEDVVLSVAFDSAAVDVTVPGDYELTFIVTIDRSAYDAAVSDTASTEPVTEEVIITKTVHIVTTEDYAAALADGTISETAEGTAIVVVEDEVDEVAVEEDSDEEDGEDAEEDAEEAAYLGDVEITALDIFGETAPAEEISEEPAPEQDDAVVVEITVEDVSEEEPAAENVPEEEIVPEEDIPAEDDLEAPPAEEVPEEDPAPEE